MKIQTTLIISFLFSISNLCYAQTQSGGNSQQEKARIVEGIVKDDFSNIKKDRLLKTVPFSDGIKYGYMDVETRKVVVPAKYGYLSFFYPNSSGFLSAFEDDYRQFFVAPKTDGSFEVKAEGSGELRALDIGFGDPYIEVVSSSDGFKGFTVDADGKLSSYSDLYKKTSNPYWNVYVLKYSGQYYGIVSDKNGNTGIIDTNGNTMGGFDFQHKSIMFNEYATNDTVLWAFVEDTIGNRYFTNQKGEKRMENEIPFKYLLNQFTVFGYSPVSKDDVSAIIDLANMSWVIAPQSKIKIYGLGYNSLEKLDEKAIENRSKATIYATITEGKLTYCMDLKQNKFKPRLTSSKKTKKK